MSPSETLLDDRTDTPATSYRLLPLGRTGLITVGIIVVAAMAWLVTVQQSRSMTGMANGLGQFGQRMPNDMGLLGVLAMWPPMMVAMMAPAVLPVALAHDAVARSRGASPASTAAFIVGFLGLWSLIGVAYLVPFLWFQAVAADAADSRWLPVAAGAVLVSAGAYEFTRRKAHCQEACCTPVSLAVGFDAGSGTAHAFRAGFQHGFQCLGCCWALMTVLLVVGFMNLVWMVGLAVLFLAQKHWRRGLILGRGIGVGLVVLGIVVMAWPALLHTISGAGTKAPPGAEMKMGWGSSGSAPPAVGSDPRRPDIARSFESA